MILLSILTVLVSWILWNVIHEMSHILAAKLCGDVRSWSIKPYPHRHNGSFRFAGAYWYWEENGRPSDEKQAIISLAPRVPNVIAAFLLLTSICHPYVMISLLGAAHPYIMLFLLAGMVDLFVGSLGIRDSSDLKRAASKIGISPWYLRLPGLTLILMVVASLCWMLLK